MRPSGPRHNACVITAQYNPGRPLGGSLTQRTKHLPFRITRLHSSEPDADVAVVSKPERADEAEEVHLVQGKQERQSGVAAAATALLGTRRSLQARAGRKLFYPSERTLKYLDGSLPGDYGWDPLGLADPTLQGRDDPTMNLRWLSYAELIHGRWAMLAAAGALAPEVLARAGWIPTSTGLPWFQAGGLFTPEGSFAVPFFGTIPFSFWTDPATLFWTMMVAMGFAEFRRWQDYKAPGSMGQQYFLGLEEVLGGSGEPKYPGGRFFDLFNVAGKSSEERLYDLKVKEIKNGRLAMVAWLGFMMQAANTHEGPVANILDHVSDPARNNALVRVGDFVLNSSGAEKLPFLVWLVAGFAAGAVFKNAMDEQKEAVAGSKGE